MTLDELGAICAAATPLDNAKLTRYDHGGGRLAVFEGDERQLIADFYDEANREFYYAARTALPELIRRWKRLREAWPLKQFDDNDFCIAVEDTGMHADLLRDILHTDL